MASQIAFALRLCFACLFGFATFSKLRRPLAFVDSVVAYEVLPPGASRAFAWLLMPLEASLALALVTGWLLVPAASVSFAILLAFALGVALALHRGRRIPCGCFGELSEPISARTLIWLGTLSAGSLALLVLTVTAGRQLAIDTALVEPIPALVYLLQILPLSFLFALATLWLVSVREVLRLAVAARREPSLEVKEADWS